MAAIPPTPPIGAETAAITELAAVDGLMANRESVTRSSPTSMLSLRQARPLISWLPPLMIPTVVVAAVSITFFILDAKLGVTPAVAIAPDGRGVTATGGLQWRF